MPFAARELIGLGLFAASTGLGFTLVVCALAVTHFAFFEWLKAPTSAGRKLLDQFAGLRLYLGVADRDELAAQKTPSMTTGEFQRFLPYALALNVGATWANRFAAAVGPAAAAGVMGALGWYEGRGSLNNFTHLSTAWARH